MSAGLRVLPPVLAEAARKELGEDPQRLQADLLHLRQWLSKQPHLTPRTDDQFLVTFLRGCKFSLERTKEKLDAYYTLRSATPMFFTNRDPFAPEIAAILKAGSTLPLGVDALGRETVLARVAALDPATTRVEDAFKVDTMVADVLLRRGGAAASAGVVVLADVGGVTAAHIGMLSPVVVRTMLNAFEGAYPIRIKGFHILHMPSIFVPIFNLFKTFMSKKLQERVYIHSDLDSLYQHVPKEIMPKEYGGYGDTLQHISDQWRSLLEEEAEFFLKDEEYGSDEEKRQGRVAACYEPFGTQGSFRQLCVD